MSRHPRTRTRTDAINGVVIESVNGVTTKTTPETLSWTSSIDDWVGRPIIPSPLTTNELKGGCKGNGMLKSSWNWDDTTGTKQDISNVPVWPGDGGYSVSAFTAPSGWYLDTIAGTNPSRPTLTIPELIQDLIDIPRQLRDLGRIYRTPKRLLTSPKEVANQFLGIKFGWMPLVEDLRQLLDLQSYILKRNKELHDLYSGRGLRRRIRFDDDHQEKRVDYVRTLIGPNNKVVVPFDRKITRKSWATITWRPTSPPPYHPDDARWNQFSRNLVLGMTSEGLAKGLWNVIPWTWLIGWCTNVGKYTLVNSNTVPAEHSQACFMSLLDQTWSPKAPELYGLRSDSHFEAAGAWHWSRRTRIVSGSITPGFNMPHLDMSRLSVLSALFVQRTMH